MSHTRPCTREKRLHTRGSYESLKCEELHNIDNTTMDKHKDSAASAPRTRTRKIGFIKLGSLAKRVQHNGSLAEEVDHDDSLAEGMDRNGSLVEGPENYGSLVEGAKSYGSLVEGAKNYGSLVEGPENYGSLVGGPENYGSLVEGANNYGSPVEGAKSYGSLVEGAKNYGSLVEGPENYGSLVEGTDQCGSEMNVHEPSRIHRALLGLASRGLVRQALLNLGEKRLPRDRPGRTRVTTGSSPSTVPSLATTTLVEWPPPSTARAVPTLSTPGSVSRTKAPPWTSTGRPPPPTSSSPPQGSETPYENMQTRARACESVREMRIPCENVREDASTCDDDFLRRACYKRMKGEAVCKERSEYEQQQQQQQIRQLEKSVGACSPITNPSPEAFTRFMDVENPSPEAAMRFWHSKDRTNDSNDAGKFFHESQHCDDEGVGKHREEGLRPTCVTCEREGRHREEDLHLAGAAGKKKPPDKDIVETRPTEGEIVETEPPNGGIVKDEPPDRGIVKVEPPDRGIVEFEPPDRSINGTEPSKAKFAKIEASQKFVKLEPSQNFARVKPSASKFVESDPSERSFAHAELSIQSAFVTESSAEPAGFSLRHCRRSLDTQEGRGAGARHPLRGGGRGQEGREGPTAWIGCARGAAVEACDACHRAEACFPFLRAGLTMTLLSGTIFNSTCIIFLQLEIENNANSLIRPRYFCCLSWSVLPHGVPRVCAVVVRCLQGHHVATEHLLGHHVGGKRVWSATAGLCSQLPGHLAVRYREKEGLCTGGSRRESR